MRRCAISPISSFLHRSWPSLFDARAFFIYKANTINLLRKKKSGTRNRQSPLASAEDRTPATYTGNGTPAEGEVDEEENVETAAAVIGGGGSGRGRSSDPSSRRYPNALERQSGPVAV